MNEITIPIFFAIDEDDKSITIDEDSMVEEFNKQLDKVIKNPNKFIEVSK